MSTHTQFPLEISFKKHLLAVSVVSAIASVTMVPKLGYADGAIRPQTQLQTLPNFVNLVKQVKPAVVSITARVRADVAAQEENGGMQQMPQNAMPFPFPFPFQMMAPQQRRFVEARGSGFLISADGYIVTNNHVVDGATKVIVTLDDGTTLPAKIVGRDPKTDVALLKVQSHKKLPFILLGNSDAAQTGEWVVAVGNPFGLGGTVTAGIISARGRDLNAGPYDDFLQIDAPINRGNSGGPLLSQNGRVIGVNSAILSPSGGSVGIGFAIPSNTVKELVDQLRKTGHVTRGYLGVEVQRISPTMARALNLKEREPGSPSDGALVANVAPNGPAFKAGIRSGDVIVTLDGTKIAGVHDMVVRTVAMSPGKHVSIGLIRGSKPMTLDAIIGVASKDDALGVSARSDTDQRENRKLGLGLAPLTQDMRQQLGVDVDVRGAVVAQVESGSPAEQAGIKAGDIIQSVGRVGVESPRAAMTAIRHAMQTKQPILLRVQRDGQQLFIAIAIDGDNSSDVGEDN